jgi:hypothetical protein
VKRALALVVPMATWLACVGVDPVIGGPKPGERLGPCLEGRKCNAGLECRAGDEICLTPGEPSPVDGGADGGTGDADAAVEAGPTCPTAVVAENDVACPGAQARCTAQSHFCCLAPGVSSCVSVAGGACSGSTSWYCDGPHHCPGIHCCADLVVHAGGTCPNEFTSNAVVASECSNANSCSQIAKSHLCRVDTDCSLEPGGMRCKPSLVTIGGAAAPVVLGVCLPP